MSYKNKQITISVILKILTLKVSLTWTLYNSCHKREIEQSETVSIDSIHINMSLILQNGANFLQLFLFYSWTQRLKNKT